MKHRTSTVTGLVGAAATALLHSLFFAALVLGNGGERQRFPDRPEMVGAGANRGTPDGESTERRIIVSFLTPIDAETSTSTADAHLSELLRSALKLQITGPDTLPLPPLNIETDGAPVESSDAELMARTKLAGIYESQMRARIERAWALHAEFLPEQSFTCRALIRQHPDGRVSEVELPHSECDDVPALRQSLINAIFSASPLPGPPHPGVFVESFSLMFRSEAMRRHAPVDGTTTGPVIVTR